MRCRIALCDPAQEQYLTLGRGLLVFHLSNNAMAQCEFWTQEWEISSRVRKAQQLQAALLQHPSHTGWYFCLLCAICWTNVAYQWCWARHIEFSLLSDSLVLCPHLDQSTAPDLNQFMIYLVSSQTCTFSNTIKYTGGVWTPRYINRNVFPSSHPKPV